MAALNNGNGAAFAALHDYCRINHIPFSSTAVQEGAHNKAVWTATVILYNDEARRYVALGTNRRAALSAAATTAIHAEGINL
ncbi:hypothetical protein FRB94_002931 [Tulasnella sp. JGI-2019a]|nr:hypothetical protein FRB93_013137 [Tulasnella sp. JGI-2019a]KAG9013403.1 hypothetical protein FRB94_002931 [Tulasnella sp. JGI-2019a]KAG9033752.1 hypothetical protein FRB95_014439 [Tulasnella sp. JGI-2019a]